MIPLMGTRALDSNDTPTEGVVVAFLPRPQPFWHLL